MIHLRALEIPEGKDVFKYLAEVLPQYCEKPELSELFIVEGTVENPRVGIRYPGKKMRRRELKVESERFAKWANLMDFLVVPFHDGVEQSPKEFNYRNILKDFELHKKGSNLFWEMVEELHEKGTITHEPPKLGGIESRQLLEILKWLMIQEDLNYKFTCEEVGSKIKYRLETKGGSSTANGAGRSKFFVALALIREKGFSADTVSKIIP